MADTRVWGPDICGDARYSLAVTGKHRGSFVFRWRLFAAVLASAVGRGYSGEHRLSRTALGLPVVELADQATIDLREGEQITIDLRDHLAQYTPGRHSFESAGLRPARISVPDSPAKLSLVPVVTRPNPMTDTMPHPVIRLFPVPAVVEPVAEVAETA